MFVQFRIYQIKLFISLFYQNVHRDFIYDCVRTFLTELRKFLYANKKYAKDERQLILLAYLHRLGCQ